MNLETVFRIYAIFRLVSIVGTLLKTGHAALHPEGLGADFGCPDTRVEKTGLVFAGAAGFTFGWYYRILAGSVGNTELSSLFQVYAELNLFLSAIQALAFLFQVVQLSKAGKLTDPTIELKAHWGEKVWSKGLWLDDGDKPHLVSLLRSDFHRLETVSSGGVVGLVRDLVTLIDFLASLPFVLILSLLTRFLVGKWAVPALRDVDKGD